MAIAEHSVESLSDLITIALQINSTIPPTHRLWYRGINNHNHKLLPKIMRSGKAADEVFEREKRLLTRFRQRSMAYWPEGYPQNDWEHLFAMQHYGLSTRLLDWSENIFVSTYFAISSASQMADGASCHPILWCIDPIKWNRAMPGLSEYGDSIQVLTTADEELDAYRPETSKRRSKSPVAMYGAHNSKRIVAQRGTFTVWGADVGDMETFATPGEDHLLWKINLVGEREILYRDLQALGFGETMIFPELNALATELERMEGWRT
ncbi:FRG domain-containing protein [Burkholderia ambifaria]|nr:FRG domain-containing protein [Burkholderia ambifaria]ELK6211203.1 FRG domain-containing protein [Burkholderia ambifaria]